MIRKLVLAFVAALAALVAPAAAQQRPVVNFSILATESSENQMEKWGPFLRDMAQQTGLDIRPFYADDYAGLIEAMRFNKVQVGWFSQKSGLEAINRSESEVFAQASYADGVPGYYSIIQVKQDSPIRTVEDLLKCDRTLNFGMGDPNSGSGFIVPVVYLFAARGIDPEKCFKTVVNQSHEGNALSVFNDRLDAAANNTTNMKTMNRARPDVVSGLREVWRSPLLGLDPVIYRKDLDPEIKAKLRDFFASYGVRGTPEKIARERAVLASLEWGPFRLADDRILDQIREQELRYELWDMRAEKGAAADAKRQQLAAEIEKLTGQPFVAPDVKLTAEADAGTPPWVPLAIFIAAFAALAAIPQTRAILTKNLGFVLLIVVVAALVLSIEGAEMAKAGLLFSNGAAMGEYLAGFLRPDFSQGGLYAEQILVTVQIALWGTFLAVILAVPFGLLASSNIAPVWIAQPTRRLMDVFRSINELVIATLFLVAVGPGPFAGVLALTVHTTGVLAKLFSEAVEAIEPGPVEGVRATGASRLQEIVWGVVPQVLPLWTSFALYRFESNARSSTVLGIIGAGGIGALLMQNIRGFYYDRTAAIVIMMVAAVVVIDYLSQSVRKRLV